MEKNEDHKNFYEVLQMDKEKDILIVDPYVLHMPDVMNLETGIKNIIRVRRPFWGKGNLSEFINKVDPTEFKKLLKEVIINDLTN